MVSGHDFCFYFCANFVVVRFVVTSIHRRDSVIQPDCESSDWIYFQGTKALRRFQGNDYV